MSEIIYWLRSLSSRVATFLGETTECGKSIVSLTTLHCLYKLHVTAPALQPVLCNLSTPSALLTLHTLPSLLYHPWSTMSALQSLVHNLCARHKTGVASTPPSCPKHQPRSRQLQLHPTQGRPATIVSPPVPFLPAE